MSEERYRIAWGLRIEPSDEGFVVRCGRTRISFKATPRIMAVLQQFEGVEGASLEDAIGRLGEEYDATRVRKIINRLVEVQMLWPSARIEPQSNSVPGIEKMVEAMEILDLSGSSASTQRGFENKVVDSVSLSELAILVLGAEASGTRVTTSVLLDSGAQGEPGHEQEFDQGQIPHAAGPLVWRRSVPHAGGFADIAKMVQRLQRSGYRDIRAVVTHREWGALIHSQVVAHHATSIAHAEHLARTAYAHIYASLARNDILFVPVSLESLMHDKPHAVAALQTALGLPQQATSIEVSDSNAKHYDNEPTP